MAFAFSTIINVRSILFGVLLDFANPVDLVIFLGRTPVASVPAQHFADVLQGVGAHGDMLPIQVHVHLTCIRNGVVEDI